MLPYQLEHLFSYSAQLHPPEIIGPVAEGLRANFYVASGEVSGPRVVGVLRPVGGDWITVRTDGVGILDVRITIETQDQALIYLAYSGVADIGPDGYQRFGRGELPPRISLQAGMRTQTAHPAYQWLNRLQCLNIGEVDSARLVARYDVYAVH
ncbi:MAG: DUF3237 domain-containing protein [Caldilineaceae bacterium]|nr:DUF3237 domain-containing protein [Caldilineaceae bacterium]